LSRRRRRKQRKREEISSRQGKNGTPFSRYYPQTEDEGRVRQVEDK
jgi:hypothetical protein